MNKPPSLIHPRTTASLGMHRSSLSRQRDHYGRACTMILAPEKRKVGGSTPPLTTLLTCEDVRVMSCLCTLGSELSLISQFHLPERTTGSGARSRRPGTCQPGGCPPLWQRRARRAPACTRARVMTRVPRPPSRGSLPPPPPPRERDELPARGPAAGASRTTSSPWPRAQIVARWTAACAAAGLRAATGVGGMGRSDGRGPMRASPASNSSRLPETARQSALLSPKQAQAPS
jgi:hypothetical protein